jgi:hypothetical protein
MRTLRVHLLAGVFLGAAACASPHIRQAARTNATSSATTESNACEPTWTRLVPRDSFFFYFPEPGTDATFEGALTRAYNNAASAYVARASASVSQDVQYTTRHGSRAAADSAVLLAINTAGMASALELIERSKVCEIPEGYRVWALYRAPVELTFRRIQDADPSARGIDFVTEYRKLFRQP